MRRIFGILFCAISLNSYSKTINDSVIFDISSTPKQKDWQYFFQTSDDFKIKLWTQKSKEGKLLSDWSWEWRIAWVKACKNLKVDWCLQIYEKALSDKAMVVRSEAAIAVGEKYFSTQNLNILRLLELAYQNPQNMRNNKPLFVQQRILFAIKQIGGSESLKIGEALANKNGEMKEYWQKVARY